MDASGAALLGERTSTRFIVPLATKKRFPAAWYTMWRRCGSLAGASMPFTESVRTNEDFGTFSSGPG